MKMAAWIRCDDDRLLVAPGSQYRIRFAPSNVGSEFGLNKRVSPAGATAHIVVSETSNGDELLEGVSHSDLLDVSQMTWLLDENLRE
jgi:hypothetical protein